MTTPYHQRILITPIERFTVGWDEHYQQRDMVFDEKGEYVHYGHYLNRREALEDTIEVLKQQLKDVMASYVETQTELAQEVISLQAENVNLQAEIHIRDQHISDMAERLRTPYREVQW